MSTKPSTTIKVSGIEDVQGSADSRNIAIDRVGIKALRHPIKFTDRSGEQNTVATFNMAVSLSADFKGTHMSRFVDILNNQFDSISVDNFDHLLRIMCDRLEAEQGEIEMEFPWFINKKAPVSGVQSVIDYQVTLLGKITEVDVATAVRVVVPVTSLCPCSKKISDYGAHNQRSHVTVEVTVNQSVQIEELIDVVESEASAELYGMLKRIDEKYVTERAYDNPKFVEDMVRDVAVNFNKDDRITAYSVSVENFESIHNHSAYAEIHYTK